MDLKNKWEAFITSESFTEDGGACMYQAITTLLPNEEDLLEFDEFVYETEQRRLIQERQASSEREIRRLSEIVERLSVAQEVRPPIPPSLTPEDSQRAILKDHLVGEDKVEFFS